MLLAACQPTTPTNTVPTAYPFPTATVGRTVHGVLPLAQAAGGGSLANPATAAALSNQPTATPDYSACPAPRETVLGERPLSPRGIVESLIRYLSDGGTRSALETGMRDWGFLGETGYLRGDLDLTGEGAPEIIIGYTQGELAENGVMLILGCANGGYVSRYQAIASGENPPQILDILDLNYDQQPDILFTDRVCQAENVCTYQTQLITWNAELGRFSSILNSAINSDKPPEVRDIDNDNVGELIVRLDNAGSAATGPLRTGINIYDWNGSVYVLSIIQLDPPRFKIQVVHEADRAFALRDTSKAIPLYNLALDDPALQAWRNDDPVILHSYTLYRLLLAYAYTEDSRLLNHYQRIIDTFPDPAARPVYATMSDTFWNALQVTNNLHSACLEVLVVIVQQPEALTFINRYGSRSPSYSAPELCPF